MNAKRSFALAAGLLILTAGADTKTWKTSGATDYTDWTDANNFEGGAPQAGDTVSIPKDVTVYLNASDTASCALATTLDRIQPEAASSKLVVTVNASDPNDGVLSLGCKIAHVNANGEMQPQREFGEVVKKGDGELYLTDGSSRYYYYTSFTVDAGTLRLPQNCSTSGERFYNRLTLAEGATLFLCTGSGCKDTYCRNLIGVGVVTNTLASSTLATLFVYGGTAAKPIDVRATFAPNTRLAINAYVNFLEPDYAYQGLQVNYGGHCTFTNFGYAATTGESSLGHGAIELKVKGGCIHYG